MDALEFEAKLFPNGPPSTDEEWNRLFEQYKMMVASSEALVARRQGVNTFFLTVNGALLTAVGLFLHLGKGQTQIKALAILALTVTGGFLCWAWKSLLKAFGQLNTGKFKVINRLEELLPAGLYEAEWVALEKGENPKVYTQFTKREAWAPWGFLAVYGVSTIISFLIGVHIWIP